MIKNHDINKKQAEQILKTATECRHIGVLIVNDMAHLVLYKNEHSEPLASIPLVHALEVIDHFMVAVGGND